MRIFRYQILSNKNRNEVFLERYQNFTVLKAMKRPLSHWNGGRVKKFKSYGDQELFKNYGSGYKTNLVPVALI
jgi:hypothetical protein